MELIKGTIQANGLNFGYMEMGTGEPVFCFHGYPDSYRTWLPTLKVLADNGYRAIAPALRGYVPTDIPADGEYSAVELGQDVIALIEAFGYEQALVIGHDWGAMSAYSAANQNPSVIKKMVTVAIPHPRAIKPSLRGLWKARHFLLYQNRRFALWRHKRNPSDQITDIFKRWSPDWQYTYLDVNPIVEDFLEPGRIEAALGYYWSFGADQRDERAKRLRKTVLRKTEVDTLCIAGKNDGALEPSQMADTPVQFTGLYRYKILDGCGHFLHQEKPAEFHKLVLEFFKGE